MAEKAQKKFLRDKLCIFLYAHKQGILEVVDFLEFGTASTKAFLPDFICAAPVDQICGSAYKCVGMLTKICVNCVLMVGSGNGNGKMWLV